MDCYSKFHMVLDLFKNGKLLKKRFKNVTHPLNIDDAEPTNVWKN